MPNNLYNTLNNGGIMGQLNSLKSNPLQFLMQRKFNLPQNFQGGPRDIIQYFLNTGQISQDQLNQVQNKVNSMKH